MLFKLLEFFIRKLHFFFKNLLQMEVPMHMRIKNRCNVQSLVSKNISVFM